MTGDEGYLLANQQSEAGRRFDALSQLFDPVTLMAGRGAELAFGRTLPRLLREAGLDAVQADAYFPITAPACSELELATVGQIRDRLVAAGLATEAEIEQHVANVASGRLDLATAPLISAWGRKPH